MKRFSTRCGVVLLLCFLGLATASAQEKALIRTIPLSDFQMPESVRQQFKSSGCPDIGQSNLKSEPHNVLHGEFAVPGQQDWMAVCKTADGSVQARFIWGGLHRCDGSPFSNDLLLHLAVSSIEIPIVPYLQAASPRKGQDHERLLERWSAPGVLSYYCKDSKWERTPGDTCQKNLVEERPTKTIGLSIEERAARQDVEGLARTLLQKAVHNLSSAINVSDADGRCMPARSVVQTCHFQMVGDKSLDATTTVEKIGGAWFATKAEATVCRLQ